MFIHLYSSLLCFHHKQIQQFVLELIRSSAIFVTFEVTIITDSRYGSGHVLTNNRNFVERIASIITLLTDSITYAYTYIFHA